MNLKVLFCFLLTVMVGFSQDEVKNKHTFDASPFYGSVILHNPDISHLITEHPAGFILGYNRKTFGNEEWEQWYNYPDLGASFIYQDKS